MKAIWLNREEILKKLRKVSEDASKEFPEIHDIRLFGSLAKGEETGLSDIDIFIVAERQDPNPVERIKRYFSFFSDRLKIGIDIIVATPEEMENYRATLEGSILLTTPKSKISNTIQTR
ncbi:MAG: nucleotidyltransferase domain-containing protein [Candidatus Jordarchaeum sp.]|uniref:nucleotidyltransferase domain-containing protein n=1 Tax=Candidatus Jordarchaeum sp. TaxID=2823881 RepID=UPI0040496687